MDCWKIVSNKKAELQLLEEKFKKDWDLRADLLVTADAGNRTILLNGVRHNVKTVREYITVLKAACNYVEELNPEWARL